MGIQPFAAIVLHLVEEHGGERVATDANWLTTVLAEKSPSTRALNRVAVEAVRAGLPKLDASQLLEVDVASIIQQTVTSLVMERGFPRNIATEAVTALVAALRSQAGHNPRGRGNSSSPPEQASSLVAESGDGAQSDEAEVKQSETPLPQDGPTTPESSQVETEIRAELTRKVPVAEDYEPTVNPTLTVPLSALDIDATPAPPATPLVASLVTVRIGDDVAPNPQPALPLEPPAGTTALTSGGNGFNSHTLIPTGPSLFVSVPPDAPPLVAPVRRPPGAPVQGAVLTQRMAPIPIVTLPPTSQPIQPIVAPQIASTVNPASIRTSEPHKPATTSSARNPIVAIVGFMLVAAVALVGGNDLMTLRRNSAATATAVVVQRATQTAVAAQATAASRIAATASAELEASRAARAREQARQAALLEQQRLVCQSAIDRYNSLVQTIRSYSYNRYLTQMEVIMINDAKREVDYYCN